MANSHNQSISIYRELEVMGFGLKELRLLYHTINEIADANNIALTKLSISSIKISKNNMITSLDLSLR
jgi:hypothetical protein